MQLWTQLTDQASHTEIIYVKRTKIALAFVHPFYIYMPLCIEDWEAGSLAEDPGDTFMMLHYLIGGIPFPKHFGL